MVLETHMKLWKTFCAQKVWKMDQKWGFFEFIEKFGHYFFLSLFYHEHLLCSCINPILKKNFVPKIIRLHDFWINFISWTNCWNNPIFCMLTKFKKVKSWSKFFWVGMVKDGCSKSGLGTRKLILSREWADAINCLFPCLYKVWFLDGCGLLVHDTLKSAVS